MSIASEYAARVAAAEVRPEKYTCPQANGGGSAHVSHVGWLVTNANVKSEEALKLAAWIIATFGETK